MNWFKNKKTLVRTVIYYGPKDIKAVVSELQKIHTIPAKFAIATTPKEFKQKNKQKIKFFCWYEYGQAETRWIRNTNKYNATVILTAYFGGGMGSIVFQTIRESKFYSYCGSTKKNYTITLDM
jgi:predicted Zn-dependent peptidase